MKLIPRQRGVLVNQQRPLTIPVNRLRLLIIQVIVPRQHITLVDLRLNLRQLRT
jgi:hypothetical protein